MLSLLVMVRDFLLAVALAWVGVTLEARSNGDACTGEACQTQNDK
jgi:hypothetical protein